MIKQVHVYVCVEREKEYAYFTLMVYLGFNIAHTRSHH